MGQRVQGIVYGVFPTNEQWDAFREENGDVADFFGTFGFRVETGDGIEVFGIAVAVAQNAGDEGEIPVCAVADLEAMLKSPIKDAKKKWKVLAKWAKGKGVVLDAPELLLVPVERA